jgi:caspase domain-containing protein
MRLLLKVSSLSFLILLASSVLFAQNTYSGKWNGTANWGIQKFTMSIDLLQTGDSLHGEVFIQSLNENKFAKYPVAGIVKNKVAFLKGANYISKKGIWCLPGIELVNKGDFNLLGKWKPNPKINGCLIAGVGKIELAKELPTKPDQSLAVNRSVSIAADDKEGNTLVTELSKRKYYALIIAVQDYKDPSIIDLNQPLSDAQALKKELLKDYSFEAQDITLLANPNRTQIIETFDKLTASVKNTDNLVVFYAGHGIWDDRIEQGYWLPSDAKKSSKAAWLSNGTIRDYIRAIDSKHTLLITDACFSGGILKTREAFKESKAILEMYKLPSRKAMTSGSLKTVPDKSVFIEYLIKALQQNNQPLISADQLFNSFKYNVINNSQNGQVPQYGVISQADDEGGDFIFLRK